MTRHAQFVVVVQTAVLVLAFGDMPWGVTGPVGIVAMAAALPEESIPQLVEAAALEFVSYACGNVPKPDWVAASEGA